MAGKLDCRQALKMIRPYLDEELGGRDSALFLAHIRECESCRREMETSFIVDYALLYLDEDKMDSFDIKGLLDARIAEGERRMARRQTLTLFLWIGIVVMAIIIAAIVLQVLLPELFHTIAELVSGRITQISGGIAHE